MSGELQVREFRKEDQQQVIALWNEVLPSTQPWNDPETIIRRKQKIDDRLFFVGALAERIVATVLAGYDGVRGWIYAVAVAPDCRRHGIGRRMIDKAERTLRSRGCQKINLQVRSSNREVVTFYEKLDFAVEDRVSMGKPLSPPEAETILDPVPTLGLDDGFELSQIRPDDKPAYLEHLNATDQFHHFMLTMPYPYTDRDAEDWLFRSQLETLETNRVRNWAIRHSGGELIGGAGLFDLTVGERAEVGYWLAQPYWGRGITSRAVRRLVEHAFAEYRLQRIFARVLQGNTQSERVLQKAGFQKEGTLRRHYFHDGKAFDMHFYGLVPDA